MEGWIALCVSLGGLVDVSRQDPGTDRVAFRDPCPYGVEIVLRGCRGGDMLGLRPLVAGAGQVGKILDHQDLLRRLGGGLNEDKIPGVIIPPPRK